MALQIDITKMILEVQLSFPNAYHKIVSVNGDKHHVNIHVATYKGDSKSVQIDDTHYTFTPNLSKGASNFIEQGYEYLKTLDKYIDAIDV